MQANNSYLNYVEKSMTMSVLQIISIKIIENCVLNKSHSLITSGVLHTNIEHVL